MTGERMKLMVKGGYENAWVWFPERHLDVYGVAAAGRNYTRNEGNAAVVQMTLSSRVILDGVEVA